MLLSLLLLACKGYGYPKKRDIEAIELLEPHSSLELSLWTGNLIYDGVGEPPYPFID